MPLTRAQEVIAERRTRGPKRDLRRARDHREVNRAYSSCTRGAGNSTEQRRQCDIFRNSASVRIASEENRRREQEKRRRQEAEERARQERNEIENANHIHRTNIERLNNLNNRDNVRDARSSYRRCLQAANDVERGRRRGARTACDIAVNRAIRRINN